MSTARLGELERRLANMQRPGTIAGVDYANARVQVKCGDNTTAWIPWMTARAGGDRSWNPPEVGEQVLVLSPSGEMAQAYCLPSIYQNSAPANGNSADQPRTDFKDGASIQYDRAAHVLTVDLKDTGTAKITTGAATFEQTNGGIKITVGGCTLELTSSGLAVTGGSVTADGDVKAGSISLKSHVHGGVQTGGGNTGAPQA